MISLLDILSPECIKVPLKATDKKAAIEELVDVLAAAGKVHDSKALKESVWTRELTRTTGIGHGLAIPHGKTDGVKQLAMAIGKPASPLDFASIDNRPVSLVVLLASPLDKTSDHIQALAKISRLMNSEEFRTKMYSADSAQSIYDLLKRQEATSAAPKPAGV